MYRYQNICLDTKYTLITCLIQYPQKNIDGNSTCTSKSGDIRKHNSTNWWIYGAHRSLLNIVASLSNFKDICYLFLTLKHSKRLDIYKFVPNETNRSIWDSKRLDITALTSTPPPILRIIALLPTIQYYFKSIQVTRLTHNYVRYFKKR